MSIPREVSHGKGSEGGDRQVVSPVFGHGDGGNKASQEAVSLLGGKSGAAGAHARETAAPLPVGADMPGMGADRFNKLLSQAGHEDKHYNPAAALAQKGGNMESANGAKAFNDVHAAMVQDKPLNHREQTTPAPNVHHAENHTDVKKKAS
jgi:hypothetical protein